MLSYPDCHVRALEPTRHTRQVTSLLFKSEFIISRRISAFSAPSGSFFEHENMVFNGEQEKEYFSRVRVG